MPEESKIPGWLEPMRNLLREVLKEFGFKPAAERQQSEQSERIRQLEDELKAAKAGGTAAPRKSFLDTFRGQPPADPPKK